MPSPQPPRSEWLTTLKDIPDPRRRERQLDVKTERGRDGVRDRSRRADRAALAHALRAERVERRRRLAQAARDRRHRLRRRQVVVVEIDSERLPVLVVADVLVQALADALHHRADDLALREQRIDDAAAVVDADELHDLDLPG